MKIRVLGCGGSFGSPLAWGRNGNIDINNPKNHRTKFILLESTSGILPGQGQTATHSGIPKWLVCTDRGTGQRTRLW